jgi:integrase
MPRISKRSVDALTCPPGKDRIFLWDDSIAGFGVVAFPSGKKAYVCQYRRDGLSCRVTIGSHGRLTPNQARGETRKLLGSVEAGADTARSRRQARSVRAFGDVAEDFLRFHVEAKRKAITAAEYRRVLKSVILPTLGRKRVDVINQADMVRIHTALSESPYEANKVLAIVSSMWNWATSRAEPGLGPNPCVRIGRYPERARERFLTGEELARLGGALRGAKIDPFAASAILLLILTGARLREILDAQWSRVDYERGIIFLPDSKTGAKPIYLNAAALAILAGIPHLEGNPHIIPGSKPGAPMSGIDRPWYAVTKAAGLGGLRIHDLRHSFASVGAGSALGLPVLGKLLGHMKTSTTSRYAHLDADPVRRAAETIGAAISSAMNSLLTRDNHLQRYLLIHYAVPFVYLKPHVMPIWR